MRTEESGVCLDRYPFHPCETPVDGASVWSPGVWGGVAGSRREIIFPQPWGGRGKAGWGWSVETNRIGNVIKIIPADLDCNSWFSSYRFRSWTVRPFPVSDSLGVVMVICADLGHVHKYQNDLSFFFSLRLPRVLIRNGFIQMDQLETTGQAVVQACRRRCFRKLAVLFLHSLVRKKPYRFKSHLTSTKHIIVHHGGKTVHERETFKRFVHWVLWSFTFSVSDSCQSTRSLGTNQRIRFSCSSSQLNCEPEPESQWFSTVCSKKRSSSKHHC